jgi:NTE family protein
MTNMPKTAKQTQPKSALIFSGGGARGAYEAGVLHFIRTQLPKNIQQNHFNIYAGTSIGGLNACFCAATAQDIRYQGQQIFNVWYNLHQNNIYMRDLSILWQFINYSLQSPLRFFNANLMPHSFSFKGLLDTSPMLPYLRSIIDFQQIQQNIQHQKLEALVLAATNVQTGKTTLFLNKQEKTLYTGDYFTCFDPIKAEHAAASAAIPLIFPPIYIDQVPYIDGGTRLNTPLSPAIQLGADKLLVISLKHEANDNETNPIHKGHSLGQILSRMMNNIFLDRIDADLEQLNRINKIIELNEEKYGQTYLKEMNQYISEKKETTDFAARGLKKLKVLAIAPSQDLGILFYEAYHKNRFQKNISWSERLMARILDIDPETGFDLLSYVAFMPDYIHQLLALGFEDARQQKDKLIAFFNHDYD